MIRRPPRSTLFPLHDALPISQPPTREGDDHAVVAPLLGGVAAGVPGGASDRGAPGGDGGQRGPPSARRTLRQRSEEHTSELQSRQYLVCRLLLEKKKPHPAPG